MNIVTNNTKILRFSSWKSIFPFQASAIRLHEMCWMRSDEKYSCSAQNINRLLFTYTIDGSGLLKYGGKEYRLDRGTAIIIDMRKPFKLQSNGANWHFFWLQMSSSLAYDLLPHIENDCGNVIMACSDIIPVCDRIFNLSTQVWSSRTDLEISSLLYHLMGLLLATALPDQRLEQVILYIHDHYSEKICLEDLSEIACMSKYYFTRVFRRETGMTPLQYVIRHRISIAQEMLTSSRQPISEIAVAVGFEDASYFSETFKKTTGYLPKEYRGIVATGS